MRALMLVNAIIVAMIVGFGLFAFLEAAKLGAIRSGEAAQHLNLRVN